MISRSTSDLFLASAISVAAVCGLSLLPLPALAAKKKTVEVSMLPFTMKPIVVKKELAAITGAISSALEATDKFKVRASPDVIAALDKPAQKALALCKAKPECIVKATSALDTGIILTGDVTKAGKNFTVKLQVISTKSSTVISHPHQVGPAANIPDMANALAGEIATDVAADPGFAAVPVPEAAPEAAPTAAPKAVATPAPAPTPEAKTSVDAAAAQEATAAPTDDDEEEAPKKKHKKHKPHLRSASGFMIGLEFGGGPWSVDPNKLATALGPNFATKNGLDALSAAEAFTNPMNNQWLPALNLHLGWNILGYASIEAAFQMSFWSVATQDRGGVGLAGGRATIYPLQFFWVDRPIDVGLEFGGGYTIGGGPTYGMDGSYFQFGVVVEYFIVNSIGVEAFYRLQTPFWNELFLNYNDHLTASAPGFSAMWNTIGIGIVLHASP